MTFRIGLYFALALIGLVGTWSYNIIVITQNGHFFEDWFHSGPAVSSLSVDMLVAATAGIVFMIAESRRIEMNRWWTVTCLVTIFVIAFAFALPFFLGLREITVQRRREATRGAAPTTSPHPSPRP